MRYLFYLGHPAHFHLFRHVVERLVAAGGEVRVVIKRKDVLESLLDGAGWTYENVLTRERQTASRFATAWGLLVRDLAVHRIARRFRPHVMVGTSAEIAHVGRLLRIPSVVVSEDDWDVIPLFARLTFPFADHILAPRSCRMGRWAGKTTFYDGCHELAYLHPAHFSPDPAVAEALRGGRSRYFILRFARLTAHHDVGRRGITDEVAKALVERLEPHGRVLITSERPLSPAFEPYRYAADPLAIHHALAGADLYVGDSQTMACEAAVLGTPSIRFNDFVGEIGYLDELEHRYGLTVGIPASQPERLLHAVSEAVAASDGRAASRAGRLRMLREYVDLAALLTWYLTDFPTAPRQLARDPRWADGFRQPQG